MNEIRLTGLHGNKGWDPYDYARNIAEIRFVYFRFAEYERDGNQRREWTGRSWEAVVSVDVLRNWLEKSGRLEEVVRDETL